MTNIVGKIFKDIYGYFPKNIPYSSSEYKESVEFSRLLKKMKIAELDFNFKNYLEGEIKNIFSGYYFKDWNNLKEYNNFEYFIMLHKGQNILDNDIKLMKELKGKKEELYIAVSILGRYYYKEAFMTLYNFQTQKWKDDVDIEIPPSIKDNIKNLKSFFDSIGYIEVDASTAKIIVPDIETDMTVFGETTIFDCIFNNFYFALKKL